MESRTGRALRRPKKNKCRKMDWRKEDTPNLGHRGAKKKKRAIRVQNQNCSGTVDVNAGLQGGGDQESPIRIRPGGSGGSVVSKGRDQVGTKDTDLPERKWSGPDVDWDKKKKGKTVTRGNK